MEYKFKEKWPTDTNIGWWNKNRRKLNEIIDAYNNWQIEDDFDKGEAKKILAKIEYGKQILGSQDGGEGYMEDLNEMKEFVQNKIKDNYVEKN